MNDYISREDILDIASQYCRDDDGSCSKADVDLREMLDEIEALPAADVLPVKQGRWIISNLYAQCSECSVAYDLDTFQRLIPMNENVPRHCSYCGARMKQEG